MGRAKESRRKGQSSRELFREPSFKKSYHKMLIECGQLLSASHVNIPKQQNNGNYLLHYSKGESGPKSFKRMCMHCRSFAHWWPCRLVLRTNGMIFVTLPTKKQHATKEEAQAYAKNMNDAAYDLLMECHEENLE